VNKITSAESSRLTVTYCPLGDLIPDPRNARTHPKRQIDQIRASIEAFGFTNPVLADPEEAALARLDRRLSPAEQRTIVKATRTPNKVKWPEWWSKHP
jgi:ParB-like nuclease domain